MQRVTVPVQLEDDSCLPSYSTADASGADARAHLAEALTIFPGMSAIIPTGVRFDLPPGYEIQVRPRSGFAAKNQITVVNSPGTIDRDYRGEVCVILINHGKEPFVVTPNMRIAQFVLAPVVQAEFVVVETVSCTQRGEGKFGHTGAH